MKTFTTTDGKTLVRLSRWIKLHYEYVSKKHSLYDYADTDSSDDMVLLIWFQFRRKKYAMNQFICMNGVWANPVMFEDETGKLNYLSGYDCEDYYNPIMIELSEDGEYVRVYQYL